MGRTYRGLDKHKKKSNKNWRHNRQTKRQIGQIKRTTDDNSQDGAQEGSK